MLSLGARLILRHAARRKLRVFLSFTAIAASVALWVSMEVTSASIRQAFEGAVSSLLGRTEIQVTAGGGVDPAWLARIEALGLAATPVIQAQANTVDVADAPLVVLGVDLAKDARLRGYRLEGGEEVARLAAAAAALGADWVALPRRFAQRHGLARGQTLRLSTAVGVRPLVVAALFEDTGAASAFGGNLAVVDLATAQRLFRRPGRADRIDVAAAPAMPQEEALRRLRAALPGARVEPVERANPVLDVVLSQIKGGLSSVSLIAMLVAVFIVYNAISVSVIERVRDLATLRALGAGRRQLVGMLLAEAAILGALATPAGFAAGTLFARITLDLASAQVNTMTFLVSVDRLAIPPDAWWTAAAVGILVPLAGAAVPAARAVRLPPTEAWRRVAFQLVPRRTFWGWFGLGAALLAAGSWANAARRPRLAVALLFTGFILIAPQALVGLSVLLRPVLRRLLGVMGWMAADQLLKYPSRTSLTVVTLAGCLCLPVAAASLLVAFRTSTGAWMDEVLPFDFTLSATDMSKSLYSPVTLPADALARARRAPGVRLAYGVRVEIVRYQGQPILVSALDHADFLAVREITRPLTESDRARSRALRAGNAVVSRNFAELNGVRLGQTLVLDTPAGPARLAVAAIILDFSWPKGMVILDRGTFNRYWDDRLSYVDVKAAPGTDPDRLRAAIGVDLARDYQVFAFDRRQIKAIGHEALDRWFHLGYGMILLALFIGLVGITNTLLISVLMQVRQIGLLRAIGATQGQVGLSVLAEGAMIGLVGSLIGVLGGVLGARFPLAVLVLEETGFTYPFILPWGVVAGTLAAGLAIGLAGSWTPARRAAGLDVLEAIGWE